MDPLEDKLEQFKKGILQQGQRLKPDDRFCFECHSGLECFNRCCHDVNIFLTPYDIIRIKNRLGLDSEEFLERHAIVPFSKNQRYPVVVLKMLEEEGKPCPFLNQPDGCSIYEDRPWACRMYPLGMASGPDEKDSRGDDFYFEIENQMCEGVRQSRQWSVQEWLENQQVDYYDLMGKGFQAIAQREPGEEPLSETQMDMLFMVCYDLDRFRRFVFESKFLDIFDIHEDMIEAIRVDDVELMEFGFQWLRFCLWKEPRMKMKEDIIKAEISKMDGEV